jgi:hypothetical protein
MIQFASVRRLVGFTKSQKAAGPSRLLCRDSPRAFEGTCESDDAVDMATPSIAEITHFGIVVENVMTKRLLMEEYHVSFFVPRGLSEAEVRGGRRALKSAAFRRKLRAVVAAAVRRLPSLRNVSFELTW